MKILIVHAHHEPQSFCSALSATAASVLKQAGHQVVVSDLHAMQFNPVSDRRNFTTMKDVAYLKQQQEEMHASEVNGFAADVDAEIKKLEECDLLIFSFPLWWFGMPAILKGWCDKVLAMGRVYGGGKFFENGLGESKKRAMLITTTGGAANAYDGWGLCSAIESILEPIQQGIFWFNGFLPLEPVIAWSPARIGQAERNQYLTLLEQRMESLFDEQPLVFPPLSEFPNWGPDSKNRYRVVIRHRAPVDDDYRSLVPSEAAYLKELKRRGIVMDFEMSALDDPEWRAFMKVRATDENELYQHLNGLPLARYLQFEVTRLQPLNQAPVLALSRS